MSVLSLGQAFGRVPCRWSADALALSVIEHDAERVNVPHAHEAAFVILMLDGQYTETAAQRSLPFDPFTTVYHPPGLEHQDFIGRSGVRLLMFEFRPELLDGVHCERTPFRSVRDLSGSRAAWELLSLYRRAGGDALPFESQAMQLIARVAPLTRTPRDRPSLERAREFLHARFREPLTMKEIAAAAAGLHPVYLGQAFRREYGETVGNYVVRLRVRAAAEQLAATDTPLATIAYELGFCDQSHLQRVFKRTSGLTPAVFRQTFRRSPAARSICSML